MIRALSTAASGMEAQQTRLDVTANNIANVSTAGFKKGRAEFQDLMYQRIRGAGNGNGPFSNQPNALEVGLGVRTVSTQRMFSQGTANVTNNPLDISINGNGFFRIQMPTGEIAYSRDGAFKLDQEGRIVNSNGYPLASDLAIPPGSSEINIDPNGMVSVRSPDGPEVAEVGQIEMANFTNPAGLMAKGSNLFLETAASGAPMVALPGDEGLGVLDQGSLEGSNVQVVEEMIDLISGQRAYEVNSRVIKAADEMLQQTTNLR